MKGFLTMTVVALSLAAPASALAQVSPLPPPDRRSLEVEVSKPLLSQYRLLTSITTVRVAWPVREGMVLSVRAGLAYATAGTRTSSTTVGNPSVALAFRTPIHVPAEVALTLPLQSEHGDDDYATEVAYLSDPEHRERFLDNVWSVSVALHPQVQLRQGGSGGFRLEAFYLGRRGGGSSYAYARYGAYFRIPPARRFEFGGELHGYARVTGPAASFGDRSVHTLTVFAGPRHPGKVPDILLHFPVDLGFRDYIGTTVGLRWTFQ
ncbi:MAG: hypothetical protein PVJ02_00845 [Gemmatimonadota bacterium]